MLTADKDIKTKDVSVITAIIRWIKYSPSKQINSGEYTLTCTFMLSITVSVHDAIEMKISKIVYNKVNEIV